VRGHGRRPRARGEQVRRSSAAAPLPPPPPHESKDVRCQWPRGPCLGNTWEACTRVDVTLETCSALGQTPLQVVGHATHPKIRVPPKGLPQSLTASKNLPNKPSECVCGNAEKVGGWVGAGLRLQTHVMLTLTLMHPRQPGLTATQVHTPPYPHHYHHQHYSVPIGHPCCRHFAVLAT
jgi:hypothetical protein